LNGCSAEWKESKQRPLQAKIKIRIKSQDRFAGSKALGYMQNKNKLDQPNSNLDLLLPKQPKQSKSKSFLKDQNQTQITAKPSKAKQSQAKPRKAKKSQEKPRKAKKSQEKPRKAKQSQAKQSKAKPSQAKPSKVLSYFLMLLNSALTL
jgi:hypothetical protein